MNCMNTERAQNILKNMRTKQQSTDWPNLFVTLYNKTVYLGDHPYGEKQGQAADKRQR